MTTQTINSQNRSQDRKESQNWSVRCILKSEKHEKSLKPINSPPPEQCYTISLTNTVKPDVSIHSICEYKSAEHSLKNNYTYVHN